MQFKQWRIWRVDLKVVRELFGLLVHDGAGAVKIIAVGQFTADDCRFAHGKPTEGVSREQLLALVHVAQSATPATPRRIPRR